MLSVSFHYRWNHSAFRKILLQKFDGQTYCDFRSETGFGRFSATCTQPHSVTGGNASESCSQRRVRDLSDKLSEIGTDESIAFFEVQVGTRGDIRHILHIPEVMHRDNPLKVTYKCSHRVQNSRIQIFKT